MAEPLFERPPLPEAWGNYAIRGIEEVTAPAAPGWFPETLGWQLLLCLAVLTLAWRAWKALLRWQRNAYRREALARLVQLRRAELSASEQLQAMNRLLKATAVTAYPRGEVAALSGRPWLEWLNGSTSPPLFDEPSSELLVAAAYRRAAVEPADLDRLASALESWIRHHPGPVHA